MPTNTMPTNTMPTDIMLESHIDNIFAAGVKRVVIGYSGGLDSHVLLHQVWRATKARTSAQAPSVCALHVNHGLSKNSLHWQQHCESVCKDLGVELYTFEIVVESKGSLEENARNARFHLFDTFLKESDLLLLAHHLDDQIETALFRLLRGQGFAGMPATRKLKNSRLYRPLLDTSRAQIETYAHSQRLSWIEDESNKDTAFDRNFIRLTLLPMIEERWPNLNARLKHVLEMEEETASLLELFGETDLVMAGRQPLSLSVFRGLDLLRKRNLLRHWIRQSGFSFPSGKFVSDAVRQMESSNSFALSYGELEIKGYRDKAYLLKKNDPLPLPSSGDLYKLDYFVALYPEKFAMKEVKGQGLKVAYKEELSIGFRKGGEKIEQVHGLESKKLKKLFQEQGIPPWIRQELPLIYKNKELVAIPSLPEWNMDGFINETITARGEEKGLIFSWRT